MNTRLFAMLVMLISSIASGQDEDAMAGFLQGKYQMVGRNAHSTKTYTGTVVVTPKDSGKFDVVRTVRGRPHVTATGRIESATSDRIKVFRIRFREEDVVYEGTFLMHSDLDNYARVSGYIYATERLEGKSIVKVDETQKPGLEAWFIDLGE